MNAFLSVPFGVGPAYVMDVVPREQAARGVSLFQTSNRAGNIGGMAAGGLAAQRFGIAAPVLCSALFPVAAIVLLLIRAADSGGEAEPCRGQKAQNLTFAASPHN